MPVIRMVSPPYIPVSIVKAGGGGWGACGAATQKGWVQFEMKIRFYDHVKF